jgi:hypothetical protein
VSFHPVDVEEVSQVDPSADQDARLLAELRKRRAELRESMTAVEQALASPSRIGGTHWAERVRAALVELDGDLRDHIAITEGPEGLYRELEQHAPRLIGPVDALTREHGEVTRRLEELLIAVEVADDAPDAGRVRRLGTELLGVLMSHRQRGADLVFEAYEFDVGGET